MTLNGQLTESITADGKGWNFDVSNNNKAWTGNGAPLTSVLRFREGPCAARVSGKCTFDTRTFIDAR